MTSNSGAGADPVAARTAEASDYPTIELLGDLARTEALPERGGEMLLVHDKENLGFAQRLSQTGDDAQVLIVGTIDGAVVGYAVAAHELRGGIRSAMIEELFVHPDARSVGVAAAMLDHVAIWAASCSCDVIESQVLPGNRSAKNFFERVGMKTRKMQVSAPLDSFGL